ncbi:MAG TPA: zinc-binding dehydrogenase [Firmicutes bacterium]|nr:zinc-binding dehydrogenase [Bacillota bacterium]
MGDNRNRRVVITAPRKLEILEEPIPEPGPGEALVKVRAVALCTWEQRTYTGAQRDSYPLLGGHEIAGVVEKLGPNGLTTIRPGDRVAVARLTRCGECVNCRTGLDNLCIHLGEDRNSGNPAGPGGLSDYLVAPSYQLFPIADRLTFPEAALAEPLACAVRSTRRSRPQFGDTVLIIGAGIMGLLHVVLHKHAGARVIVSEPHPDRREKALQAGADEIIDPDSQDLVATARALTEGVGPQIVVVTGGDAAAFEGAIKAAAKGGRVVMYAAMYPEPQVTLPINLIHRTEISVLGSMSQTKDDFLRATYLLSQGTVDVKPFIAHLVPFAQVREAFELATTPGTYRVVVTMEDD